MEKTMKVWITKYALTQNIYCCEARQNEDIPSMVICPGTFATYYGEGRDWHRTKEGAIKRAEQMRIAKIIALRKNISKLEKLKFE